jgi:2-(1,2-epoxy-1,2-dihydrophenyl)acetyl-CoA isomerase
MDEQQVPLVYSREGHVATLIFNRPQALNAIDADMAAAFLRACRVLRDETGVRAVLVRGNGRAFMAGGDIAGFRAQPEQLAASVIDPMHEALQLLAGQPAPVLACVHGAVAGAGLSVALACDFVIAAETTKFSFAYSSLGASSDLGASWTLPRIVGLRKALEIAMFSPQIDAARALDLGLVNQVVPAERIVEEANRVASRLAEGPTVAYGHLRQLMRSAFDTTFSRHLECERAAFKACAGTVDFKNAVEAFLSKQAVSFGGS